MKNVAIVMVALVLLGGAACLADSDHNVTLYSTLEAYFYLPDGSLLFFADYGLQVEPARVTGEVVHYGGLIGDGHIINDGAGRGKGQQFILDPWYGQLRMRYRTSGSMDVILFDDGTGTCDGLVTVVYELFGSAEEVLALYPWAEPHGSAEGRGWWLMGTQDQFWMPIFP